jgi:ankyrin repeat protein
LGNALNAASYGGHLEVLRLLHAQKNQHETLDVFGRTSLMWAAIGGHLPLILSFWPSYCILSPPATPDTDKLGCTLVHFFAIGNCPEGVCSLLDAGFDINGIDFQGWTALHWAAYFGHEGVVDVLLNRHADISHTDLQGWTAYQLSIFVGKSTIAQSLKVPISDSHDIEFRDADLLRGQCDSCYRVSCPPMALRSHMPSKY